MEQTWEALIDLLDEYALIYGETPFDWSLFQEIMSSGLENLSYGKIPTAIDQVRINRLELVRPNQAKITFAIGLNDQVFPDRHETKGLLSSEERETLNARLGEEQVLFDPAKETMSFEPLQAYFVFFFCYGTFVLELCGKLRYEYIENVSVSTSYPLNI